MWLWRILCCPCNEDEDEYEEEIVEPMVIPKAVYPITSVQKATRRRVIDIESENEAADRMQHLNRVRLYQDHANRILNVYYPRKRNPLCFQLLDSYEVQRLLSEGQYEDCFDLAKSDESLFWNTVNIFGTRVDIIDEQIKKKV